MKPRWPTGKAAGSLMELGHSVMIFVGHDSAAWEQRLYLGVTLDLTYDDNDQPGKHYESKDILQLGRIWRVTKGQQ